MSTIAIKVQHLGKKYRIRHQAAGKYQTLREAMMQKLAIFSRTAPKTVASQEDFWAVKDVSFEIKNGESGGIIGRNGAGKSTLLKILSRITDPTTGRIELHGRVGSLLEVGTGFHQELTGRENIYLNGIILGMKQREIARRFDEIVAFSEIEKFLDTPVKHYSSGMYIRLAFAVAAHLETEILVVDEVLAVGDMAFQKKCLGRMEDMAKTGRTVLFVSHNMGAVQTLCSRCLLINAGRVIADTTPQAAIQVYAQGETGQKLNEIILPKRPGVPVYASRMQVRNKQGEAISEIELGQDAVLYLEYTVEKDLRDITIAALISKEGTPLQYTYDNDADESLRGLRNAGIYVCSVHLPMSSFKEGAYTIAVAIGCLKENLTDRNASISLNIVNNHLDLTHRSYRFDRPGFIFNDVKWVTRLKEKI